MTAQDFLGFQEWQAAGPRRAVDIKIRNKFMSVEKEVVAWCYDFDLMCGEFVSSPSEINLERKKAEEDSKKLVELLAKKAEIEQKLKVYQEA